MNTLLLLLTSFTLIVAVVGVVLGFKTLKENKRIAQSRELTRKKYYDEFVERTKK